mmetsp:Transcript_2813/g.7698  ORF Transcript_2813/g.7698 Transcript_2813/m.7698 type:complete len:255 (+) Transcript_2813:3600-4364(+)
MRQRRRDPPPCPFRPAPVHGDHRPPRCPPRYIRLVLESPRELHVLKLLRLHDVLAPQGPGQYRKQQALPLRALRSPRRRSGTNPLGSRRFHQANQHPGEHLLVHKTKQRRVTPLRLCEYSLHELRLEDADLRCVSQHVLQQEVPPYDPLLDGCKASHNLGRLLGNLGRVHLQLHVIRPEHSRQLHIAATASVIAATRRLAHLRERRGGRRAPTPLPLMQQPLSLRRLRGATAVALASAARVRCLWKPARDRHVM